MVTTIRIPDDLHLKLKRIAEHRGMTLNGMLVGILWNASQEEERKETADYGRKYKDAGGGRG